VAQASKLDAAVLQEHGYTLQWIRREPAIYAILAERAGETTKLEWVADSDFRFFPTIPDNTFGYLLHPVDLATNKVAAAYGRREPRDVVDLLTIHEKILPLGAVVWASAGKALGFTPEGIINEIRRMARYTEADFRRVASDPPIDPGATMRRLHEVLAEAEAFVIRMPTEKAGLLFLKDGHVVQPDPGYLDQYQTHAGAANGRPVWKSLLACLSITTRNRILSKLMMNTATSVRTPRENRIRDNKDRSRLMTFTLPLQPQEGTGSSRLLKPNACPRTLQCIRSSRRFLLKRLT
jgi:hypothetical protein